MKTRPLTLLLFFTSLVARAGDWHEWKRHGDEGDRAFAKKRHAAAEKSYLEALRIGASLRGESPGIDPHLSRLAATRVALGRCPSPADEPALAGLMALHRGDLAGAQLALTPLVQAAPTEGCHATVLHESLALVHWLHDNQPEAEALREAAKPLRCKPLQADPLDQAASALNQAWADGGWKKALARATALLGAKHPLLAAVNAKRAGKPLPVARACVSD